MLKNTFERATAFLEAHPVLTKENLVGHPLSDPERLDPIWVLNQNLPFDPQFIHALIYIRNLAKAAFEAIEGKPGCVQKSWNAGGSQPHPLQGGGVMTVIRESILEKSAVNMSVVSGASYPSTESHYANKPFAAAGVSLISHPKNPHAPIMHLNVRCIKVFDDKNTTWIGGGADLTPMQHFDEDTSEFHAAMRKACASDEEYEKYKLWAQEYFYISHRKEERGVGGIFFDFLPVESETSFQFLLAVAQHAIRVYTQILARRVTLSYTPELLEKHLYWRGRYAEFNLVYDRGTRFGLLSGGNYEAIFCSLPPSVKW